MSTRARCPRKGGEGMALNMIYPPYEVVRNLDRCTNCRVCERQCANGVHSYSAE